MIYTKEIQIIIREYFKILYSTNLENLKEIDGFLDSAKPLKLNQEEDTNISTPITNEETKIITKKSSSLKKKSVQDQVASEKTPTRYSKKIYNLNYSKKQK